MKNFWLINMSVLMSVVMAADTFTPEQKSDIEGIIGTYITTHPELITTALQNAQEKEIKNKITKAENFVNEHTDELLAQAAAYSTGPQDAKISVIAFLDYQCGYCRTMHSELEQFVPQIPTKIAYLQLPILGPQSTKAATLALSSSSKAQFITINKALYATDGAIDDQALNKIAKQHKITILPEKTLQEKLKTNYTWAINLGIQGAPAIVVTNGRESRVFFGKVSLEALQNTIQELNALIKPLSDNTTANDATPLSKAA